jgi:hypothetical protein
VSAERLRAAAALMRERAEAATPGPYESTAQRVGVACTHCWGSPDHHSAGIKPVGHYSDTWLSGPRGHGQADLARGDSDHLASWAPEVAVRVADWLDAVAAGREAMDGLDRNRHWLSSRRGSGVVAPTPGSALFRDMEQHALAVADAYLGREADDA